MNRLSQRNLSVVCFLIARSSSLKFTESNPFNCSLYCLNYLLYFDFMISDLCQRDVSSPSLGPCSSPLLCGGLSEIAVKLLVLYWSIADSQCSDGLRWTARELSHAHACIRFPPNPLPSRLPRHGAEWACAKWQC